MEKLIFMESKFQIKERLFSTALEHWGFKDKRNIEDFDPLIELLINTISSEVYNISLNIHEVEERIVNKIISKLYSKNILQFCTHSILQVQPLETSQEINKFYQFKLPYDSEEIDIDTDNIFFSPIGKLVLYDIEARYMHYKNSIYHFLNNSKQILIDNTELETLPLNQFEIGIVVNENTEKIKKLPLYINLKSQYYQDLLFSNLNFLKIYNDNENLNFEKGIEYILDKSSYLKEEISARQSISKKHERYVASYYETYYITLNNLTIDNDNSHYQKYNSILNEKDKIIWIKFSLPFNPDSDFIQSFFCSTNYIPVMQRKLIEETYNLSSNINILPLSRDYEYMDMISITDQDNNVYENVENRDFQNLTSGKYFVRNNGVLRTNKTEVKKQIELLLRLVRDEYTSFRWLGMDTFSSELTKLKQYLARLDTTFSTVDKPNDEKHHILIYPINKQDEIVYLKYWTSQNFDISKTDMFDNMAEYMTSDFNPKTLFLRSRIISNNKEITLESKIESIKKSLISHDSIVTKADIKHLASSLFGTHIKNINIYKKVDSSINIEEGLIQIIQIDIILKNEKNIPEIEANNILNEFKLLLDGNSIMMYPIKVNLFFN